MHNIKLSNIHQKQSQSLLKRITPILMIMGILVGIGIIFALFRTASSFDYTFKIPFLGYPFDTTDDKVNVLLLGNAGGIHDGALLTDSIMVASYNLKEDRVIFISLPRDFWVDSLKSKVNAAYEIGDNENKGLKFAKEIISEILGIPIHYAVRLDFSGFEKAVDQIGGVDVEVERTFDDYNYPITGKEDDLCGWSEEEKDFSEEEAKKLNIEIGKRKVLISPEGNIATDSTEPEKGLEYFKCRYEHINFNAGPADMNGEEALEFVRSRMGTNGEGNDFARSKRQQKVLEAFRKKVLSLETLVNPGRIKGLFGAFGQSIETDIPVEDIVSLYGVSKKMKENKNYVISNTSQDPLLYNPPLSDYGGAWVLIPKGKNYDGIHEFVKKALKGELEDEATTSARISAQ